MKRYLASTIAFVFSLMCSVTALTQSFDAPIEITEVTSSGVIDVNTPFDLTVTFEGKQRDLGQLESLVFAMRPDGDDYDNLETSYQTVADKVDVKRGTKSVTFKNIKMKKSIRHFMKR